MQTVMTDEPDFRQEKADPVEPTLGDPGDSWAAPGVAGPGTVTSFYDPLNKLAPANVLGSKASIEAELDMIAACIRTFHTLQADQVMRYCAGFSARLTEMVTLLHRVEGGDRMLQRLRTQQVQKFLDELQFQFKVASRLVEVSRQDLSLLGKD